MHLLTKVRVLYVSTSFYTHKHAHLPVWSTITPGTGRKRANSVHQPPVPNTPGDTSGKALNDAQPVSKKHKGPVNVQTSESSMLKVAK